MELVIEKLISEGLLSFEDNNKIYYARKRGSDHLVTGKPCQDYVLAHSFSDYLHMVAVADGHGGEKYTHSESGSRIACECLVLVINQMLTHTPCWTDTVEKNLIRTFQSYEFKRFFINCWRKAVIEDYLQHNPEDKSNPVSIIRKYGTTLLFALITPNTYILGQLGDGAIWLFNSNCADGQLFKRHNPKSGPKTGSLASGQSIFAFYIDAYSRDTFGNVLLSTDGIYDKLDFADNFGKFAQGLTSELSATNAVSNPFCIDDIDVSQKTKDDCTIALICTQNVPRKNNLEKLLAAGYGDINCVRTWDQIEIFTAMKEDQEYDIHVVDAFECGKVAGDNLPCNLILPEETIMLTNNRIAFAYHKTEGISLAELFECGETLEKKIRGLDDDEEGEANEGYSNHFWMQIYEKVVALENALISGSLGLVPYFVKEMKITVDGQIVLFQDMLIKHGGATICRISDTVRDMLGLLGKIICGSSCAPLYKCVAQGQNICALHTKEETIPMCKVRYNEEKRVFGLKNISNTSWMERKKSGKIRTINQGGVIKLDHDLKFLAVCEDQEISSTAEVEGGYASYEVQIF